MTRRVWVLGAGFSRSLGGPLIGDLLTPESEHALGVRFANAHLLTTPGCKLARALYWFGTRAARAGVNVNGEEHHWDDPEDFLDQLDGAAAAGLGAPQRRRLEEIMHRAWSLNLTVPGVHTLEPKLGEVREGARRLLAAECASFLVNVDHSTERWSPYVRWMRALRGNDTVITFNYDLVVETLAAATARELAVMVPGDQQPLADGAPLLLKMHGSVDWRRVEPVAHSDQTATFRRTREHDLCARCDPHELAIASPGPAKAAGVKELRSIWDAALNCIRLADVIAFVGYRFPPTDASARDEILGTIHTRKGKGCLVLTVLGPNVHSPDSDRLAGLIENATGMAPRRLPLYAQDFLGLVDHVVPMGA